MSFQSLSEKLATLQASNAQLKDLIDRLATIKFQPGSIPLDNEEGNVITELTAEIQQTIRDQDDDFKVLQEEVKDLPSGREGSELEQQKAGLEYTVERAIRELKGCQTAFRKAQLTAKRSVKEAQRAERELLLQSFMEPRSDTSSPAPGQIRRTHKTAELSKDEKTVNASSDVTLALRRTHDMMTAELSRSQFAHDTLKESTAALAQLSETYSTLDTLLSSSKNLLGTLLRSQKSDTWYLETAFYVLLTTIAWLVFRRFLYGPLWWFLYFPLKMFFKGWRGVFTAMGLIGGSSVSVSSVAGRETVVHNSATGRAPRATMSGARAPSVNVGGGGRGAPMRPSDAPSDGAPQRSGESVSEEVGRIIDEGNEEPVDEGLPEDTGEGQEAGAQRNPKKRMWEEPKEAAKEEQKRKDEL